MNRALGTTPLLQLAAWSAAVLLLVAGCWRSGPDRGERVLEDGKVLQVDLGGGVVMEFVRIEPRTFVMGSPDDEEGRSDDEGPQTRVTLTQPFYLGKYEVTQAEWEAVMGANPSTFETGGRYPVEQVSWDDCQKFIERLNAKHAGRRFRLPTEAEWEYACRAGTTGARYGALDVIAWYYDNSGRSTHPVGRKRPNAWGLHDMLGNVHEWCADRYGDKLPGGSVTDPVGLSGGSCRVFRGGSWGRGAGDCRAATRDWIDPDYRDISLGLRLAISAP
ncbi:MAG: formylglycine-generating enzyme family protein [Planctomycetes bacterium]|nr:formylglycine-generating enzyme family protein [Planctomycetota bacterium]